MANIERLLSQIEEKTRTWRFGDDLPIAVAGSGLARAARLLREALALHTDPPSIGANILARAAFETWVISAWALFEGTPALLAIERERIKWERKIVNENAHEDGGQEAMLAHLDDQLRLIERTQTEQYPNLHPLSADFATVAQRIGPLVTEQLGEAADVTPIYNLFYRSHSTWDAHPYKSIGQTLVPDPSSGDLRIAAHKPWMEPIVAITHMTIYCGILGRWIDTKLGTPDEGWDERVRALINRDVID